MHKAVFCRGQPVRRQLQHKGRRLALEHSLLQDHAREDGEEQPQHIQGEDHQAAACGEEGGSEQAVYRQPGRAGHEGHQHDGHAPVLLIFHGPGAHDGGHRAAKAHEHGDKGLAGEAEPPQQPVHDKGGPGHIARVLQQGEEQEEQGDLGQEGEHAAHAGDHAVHHQAHRPGGHLRLLHGVGSQLAQSGHDALHPVGQEGAHGAKGDGEHTEHHGEKYRDGQILVCDDGVDFVRAGHLPRRSSLLHALSHRALDKPVAGVGHQGLSVAQGIGVFIFGTDPVQLFGGLPVQPQGLAHQLIPLDELHRGPVSGNSGGVGPVVDQLSHPVVDEVGIVVIKVVGLHRHAPVDLLVGRGEQRVDILPRAGGDGNDRHPQHLGESGAVDLVPVLLRLVHEVEGDDHGPLQLQKLHRQVEVALDIGGVHNVDDGVGMLAHDEVPGHDLLHGVGGQGVDPRQVHHGHVPAVDPGLALLLLHRHAGPVAHILVGAGESVEEGGLATVGVAHQGHFDLSGIVVGVVRCAAVLGGLMGVGLAHAPERLLIRYMLHHAHPAALRGSLPLRRRLGIQQDLPGILLAQ